MMSNSRFPFDGSGGDGLGEKLLKDATSLKMELMVVEGSLALEFELKGHSAFADDGDDEFATDGLVTLKRLLDRFQQKARQDGGDTL